jgi:cyclophilin family peptidyl-prolyl cis-trans isomerase/HEAT repeat protein
MLRLFASVSLALVVAAAAGCPAKTTTATGGNGEGAAVDVDAAFVDQRESLRAKASEFAPALTSSDAAVRARAVRALGRLLRLDASDAIVAAANDADAAVRVEAAFAAGELDLALDSEREPHQALRTRIEEHLVAQLGREPNADVRAALVRALGRISASAGLNALQALAASTSTTDQQNALYALGVAGARRQASRASDAGLLALVKQRLQSPDEAVRAAAAYVALRQKLPLDAATVAAAQGGQEQTRIFLARALAASPGDVAAPALATLARDADWRVRTEALRVLGGDHDWHFDAAVDALADAVKNQAKPGMHHVIAEACLAIAHVVAPERAAAGLSAALAGLPVGADAAQARCTCAAAAEVLGTEPGAVARCTQGLPAERQKKFAVLALEKARVNSQERATALTPYLNDDDVRVRVAAASAVCADAGTPAAEVAATRLLQEPDPAVAATLLECFADNARGDIIKDRTLVQTAQRFLSSTAPEASDPLIAIAALARLRPGPQMQGLREQLSKHADGRVADAANNVAVGDRAAGPRALALPAPAAGTLPLAAVLHTNRGEIVIAFERELAPRTVKNFVDLAQKGTFQNTLWHRVIGDFVSQGGDPRGDGSGGPGYTIPCEYTDASYTRGAVGMAHAGVDTGGSQFFLTHSHHPHLDGRYTLFARVVEGQDVMDALQKDDVLLSVELTTALRKTAR